MTTNDHLKIKEIKTFMYKQIQAAIQTEEKVAFLFTPNKGKYPADELLNGFKARKEAKELTVWWLRRVAQQKAKTMYS